MGRNNHLRPDLAQCLHRRRDDGLEQQSLEVKAVDHGDLPAGKRVRPEPFGDIRAHQEQIEDVVDQGQDLDAIDRTQTNLFTHLTPPRDLPFPHSG